MAFKKKEKQQANKGANILNNPEERKKFKSALATVTHYLQQVDDTKEGMKETIEALSADYGLDKKTIRKLAVTMYKHNYGSLQEENNHFAILYETLIEGKLRDDSNDVADPLDKAIDDEIGDVDKGE